ncbi:protein cordon-bleu isoform X5 [Phyllostomus hastatus]|uniref:protein cordon-bleu isoform X5 n=1 Tax=Phyllostomus hastatus TaxID=9423 RepID=UPI001E681095|nr:protein cordon-bleu isoform X5 [Phyllostomus hastatus]
MASPRTDRSFTNTHPPCCQSAFPAFVSYMTVIRCHTCARLCKRLAVPRPRWGGWRGAQARPACQGRGSLLQFWGVTPCRGGDAQKRWRGGVTSTVGARAAPALAGRRGSWAAGTWRRCPWLPQTPVASVPRAERTVTARPLTSLLSSQRKMKARAPPPPGKPPTPTAQRGQSPHRSASPARPQNLLHLQENLRDRALDLTVVLPSGLEKRSVVSGSHAMMDLLVELCLQNHLNPSHHALEIWSPDSQQPLSFKPNTLVGTLNVHTVFLKEKVPEEKTKPSPPKMPEKSVRLVVNYLRTQKAVVRVSPEVPLLSILPVICAKCDVRPEHVVLLRDNVAGEELELSKSLSELGIKELYAWDNKREPFRKASLGNDETDKEKKKFLGFFKVSKRNHSNKAEPPGLAGADSDEDTSRPAPGQGSNGCLTTPSSPSVNSRSGTLGPSLSLSNISGVSVRSDLKKRRAPPPPALPGAAPPVHDKASEKMSLGSQTDLQKKKRRAPAPPPPSPLVPPRTEGREEHRKSTTVSLPLGPGGPGGVDRVPPATPDAEETVSVGSCFASEDTTEDSGVVSSPSDIVSLGSQHDSTKSREKWATDQEDGSDQDLARPPEPGAAKSPTWERNGTGPWHSGAENAAAASEDDRDLLVTARRLEPARADLDGDPEDGEENYETDTSSLAGSVDGTSGRGTQDTDPDAIPVTFIGEVDDPVESGLFSNRNNNAGSFDRGRAAGGPAHLPPAPGGPQEQRGQQRVGGSGAAAPPRDAGRDARAAWADTGRDTHPVKAEPWVTSQLRQRAPSAQETGGEPGSALGGGARTTEAVSTPPRKEKDSDEEKDISVPPSWCQRGQNPGGSFGFKYGLTTYKIVPPKSERRCYDRGVSLSTGAIKIDELGNLVSPHVNGGRTVALPSPALEKGAQPLGGVQALLRRAGSLERRSGRPLGSPARGPPTPTAPAEAPHQDGGGGAEPSPPDHTAPSPPQPPAHQGDGRPLPEGPSRPPSTATCPVKVPAAHTTQVPFLKPQRRTSSQYVASAIAKRMGTPRAHADSARRHDDAEKTRGDGGLELRGWPRATEGDTPRGPCPEPHGREGEARSPCSHQPDTNGEASAGGQVGSPPGKPSPPDCAAGTRGGARVPLVTAAQRDRDSAGPSRGPGGTQGAGVPRTGSAPDPRRTPDGPERPLSGSGGAQAPGGPLVNGSGWVPSHGEPPHAPGTAGPDRHAALQQGERPDVPCTDIEDPDSTPPPSIFGPKKKFRPVVQRPAPKDTSLHSALMEAIHAAGGKERLRKTVEPGAEGGPKKPSYVEAESEHSALLAAIRGHRGACSLRKVASCASEELRSFREAASSASGSEASRLEDLASRPPPTLPPPPPPAAPAPLASRTATRSSSSPLSSPGDARQALMDAIRSGTGAARLRKVPLLV